MSVRDALVERIRRSGPITFAEYQELALYHPHGGFFTTGGGAGRSGRDFVTSPETGQLFGTLVARHLDRAWRALGEPDPFLVVEVGAGRGKLAADVLRAEPDCRAALRYVLVERSAALRALQRELLTLEPADEALGPFVPGGDPDEASEPVPRSGPIVAALDGLPGITMTGVVLANELLDNLPVRVVERTPTGWDEVLVGLADDGDRFVETRVAADGALAAEADVVATALAVPVGARLPVPEAAVEWLDRVASLVHRGEVLVIDYAAPAAELLERGPGGWLRTYRAHERGSDPLDAPGIQDITADVPLEHLHHAAARAGFTIISDRTQAEALADLGIDELVDEGLAVWRERAHLGDLEAIAGRSRAAEARALTDPSGLGAHRVIALGRRFG